VVNVLLLNASYEPLNIISLKRAVSLLTREVVHAADEAAVNIRTATGQISVPAVLVLKVYRNVPRRKTPCTKRGVLQRDNYTCGYCGQPGSTVDHIVPRNRGGRLTWSNAITACEKCNGRKGDRTPQEAGMRLLWEPKTPRVNYVVARGEVPATWKAYLEV
jgi:5-methylcytosine-specific restriction endonuclease McrA